MSKRETYKGFPHAFYLTESLGAQLGLEACESQDDIKRGCDLLKSEFGRCGVCGSWRANLSNGRRTTKRARLFFVVCEACGAVQPLQTWPAGREPLITKPATRMGVAT